MNIHEYQAKHLLRQFDVPVLDGKPVFSAEDAGVVAYHHFEARGISTIVVKAQIHAGGRGKGIIYDPTTNTPRLLFGKELRGVVVIRPDEYGNIAHKAYLAARQMIGGKLVTHQTGPQGKIVRRLLIEEGAAIKKEYYCSILLDRSRSQNVIMVSTEGGVDIERVAEESPEKILQVHIDPVVGCQPYLRRRLAFGLGLQGAAFASFMDFVEKLYRAYEELDCSLLEINPLILTSDDRFVALDAKVNFDDNALFRHPDYLDLVDTDEEDPLEREAAKYHLSYVKLDGNVGCMVNGAGLAMATMDIIQLAGGKPANFLDVGGGANVERIANGFRIMMSDPDVRAVLVNIFGGIVRCDRVANGIVQALQQVEVRVPVIVRLEGTNAKEALEILRASHLDFLLAETFEDAARLVTEALHRELAAESN
ncbi:MAG: succinate--CoA ligase [ADP-forming] subunit beta [Candidatus Kapaibacterium sp.]|nr:MAG: succinate--CoA ligase [ADP-forming] subunit beta [Candidatus Kapabacteria bacterium]